MTVVCELTKHPGNANMPATKTVDVTCGCRFLLCDIHARVVAAEVEYFAALLAARPDRWQSCSRCGTNWAPDTAATTTPIQEQA